MANTNSTLSKMAKYANTGGEWCGGIGIFTKNYSGNNRIIISKVGKVGYYPAANNTFSLTN